MGVAFSCCVKKEPNKPIPSQSHDHGHNHNQQHPNESNNSFDPSTSQNYQALNIAKESDNLIKLKEQLKQEPSMPSSSILLSSSRRIIDENIFELDKAVLIGKGSGNPKDKYKFIEKLGHGSFGDVYKAENTHTNSNVAIKILRKSKDEYQMNQGTRNEINMLTTLDHPNIIKIFEFYESPKHFYIITEYCKGGELFHKLKTQGVQTEIVSAIIMFQLFSAISYCHQRNIMHRDLKPENIMLEEKTKNRNLFIKLIDFGTAKLCEDAMEKQVIGTCHYIAPEVLNKKYDEKCDLWSCGVILYILVKGKLPFAAKTDNEIFEKIKLGVYNLDNNEHISNEVRDLIKKLLIVDVEQRITADEAIQHPWFKKLRIREKLYDLSADTMNNLLNNIYNYHPDKILQQAAIAYLVHHNPDMPEIHDARCMFYRVDQNNDGSITKEEFVDGLTDLFVEQNKHLNYDLLESLFNIIDADKSGNIDYEEFIRAAADKRKFLDVKILHSAFKYFANDSNLSGSTTSYGNGNGIETTQITLENVKMIFHQNKEFKDEEFQVIIDEFDTNKDGVIDFSEFQAVMSKILELNDDI